MIQDSDDFCFDVVGRMLMEPAFADKVTEAYARCQATSKAFSLGETPREDVVAAMGELVEKSGFNLGMLMPTMYPKSTVDLTDGSLVPLDYTNRPYMFALSCLATNAVISMVTGRQVGKCATGDTELTTETGNMKLSDLFAVGLPVANS